MSGEGDDKDVEEFAALLRRLKDRTDRSYGQLARRLNMNASTLHRYCVGEAVPLDFAPVERFAALCGATPEERLRLHRYWILAVAARQRPRPAGNPVSEPVPEEVPAPAPSPWYRRRLTLTAAAVCAVLAVWGTLSAVSTHDTARPRTTPTPSAPVAPLTWTADSQAWAIHCSHDYVVEKSPARVPPPPAPEDAGTWAAKQRAVHGRETDVEISVQGRTSTAVVLESLRVRVVGRAAPLHGTAYAMDQGCGGEVSPRYFGVDLDAGRPLARPVAGSDLGTPVPAVHLPYRVSAQDPEVLLVKARTRTCDCRWYLELGWSSPGRTGTLRIDDHGRPFRTTSIKGLPHYWYSAKGWAPYDG
ncbi:Helix-turn-helix domain-containing protein [Streptomyces sp. 3213]|uniref:helix-turn-helix domain-containing protein n=1 Tax=Streptomyces sp. 3213.3 TaxID=1855348 RepID=UPI0008993A68|nr:helix-turn-helix transcriptional regulator [Streptomyces sp. 3213.3]SEE70024.1 Helix-turn-helix domain-containing protein [Streptomyces sp. 3213] [Streptomyces sp. 3213.3]